MKFPESVNAIVEFTQAEIHKERSRRFEQYEDCGLTPELLDLLPMFKLTHSTRARRCCNCERRIDPLEFHFIHDGSRLCQDDCMDRDRAPQPRLRLIHGGLDQTGGEALP